jgi:hypothetical protein
MKHIKLFEDFTKAETAYELNDEVKKYKLIKPLPPDGNADIKDQFEILCWIKALEDARFKPLNNLHSFNKVAHISWSTITLDDAKRKRYGLRADVPNFLTKQKEKDEYNSYKCEFDDYFEPLPQYTGHHTGKQYGI